MQSIFLLGAMLFAQPIPAAQPDAKPADASPTAATAPVLRLPALTPLRLRIVGEVSSKTHAKGDKVEIVLADPIRLSATLVIPAATRGTAEVIHSAKGGMGGKAGELLIAARNLELAPGIQIPLRSFRLEPASGKNNEGLATGLAIAGGMAGGLAALVMTGGSARVPAGSEGFAKTAADVDIPVTLLTESGGSPVLP